MDYFNYREEVAYCEDIPLATLAEAVGTPAYIYSRATLKKHLHRIREAFGSYPTLPCFAVKANSNLSILKDIFAAGFGADLVSGGELTRSLRAGVQPSRIVFSGVGKTDSEIRQGIEAGILCFNVESRFELERINRLAVELDRKVSVALRVNPNIDAKTNPKIATGLFSTKFGIAVDDVFSMVAAIETMTAIQLTGIACHIGSQMIDLAPLADAAEKMASLAQELMKKGHPLRFLNMGGGLGIRYKDEPHPQVEEYAQILINAVKPTGLTLIIEPGRVVVGNVGILLTTVLGIKTTPHKVFAVVDGAMNDVIRPSLYDSYHEILPVNPRGDADINYDVVGPICETGDYFGKDRKLPKLDRGDLLYLRGCGAYAASMASNYNSRPRSPEVMVDGDKFYIVRPREQLEDLWRGEDVDLP